MARLFGTDGVRGVVNEFLTPELAYHLGRAAATHFGKEKEHPTFLICRDTRISGSMLECALASGICSVGGNVVMAGVIPTPNRERPRLDSRPLERTRMPPSSFKKKKKNNNQV